MIVVTLIVVLVCIILNILFHLAVIFYDKATEYVVKKVMENPYKYVREEEMCYFIRNVFALLFVAFLLYCACSGTFIYDSSTKILEIGNK